MADPALDPPTTPTLYHHIYSSSSRPYALIAELGASCPISVVPITTAQLKTDAFLTSINPQRRLPIFHDPATGTTLTESGGLCAYILEKYDDSRTLQPAPGSPARATFLQLLHFGPATLYHACVPMLFAGEARPEGLPQTSEAEFKKAVGVWRDVGAPTLVAALRKHGGPFMCGEVYTAADAVVSYDVMAVSYCEDKTLLGAYPELKAWFERVSERKSYKTVLPACKEAWAG